MCVSTHDLPPGLGREVILAFSYPIHMFSAFALLHWLSFLRLHIRDSFVLPSSSYRMVLFCFRHASSRPYVQHFHVASLVFLSRLAYNSSFVLDVHRVLWFHLVSSVLIQLFKLRSAIVRWDARTRSSVGIQKFHFNVAKLA